jgi:hypothetical protein
MDELGVDEIGRVASLMAPFRDRFPSEALADGSLGGRLFADSRECATVGKLGTQATREKGAVA